MLRDAAAVLTAVGALATAVAVFIAFVEWRGAKEYSRTSFEDDLSREYRGIIGQLPAEAFYISGDSFAPDESAKRAFFRYVDLSNEQLFLARRNRVSAETADQWKDGIRGNLEDLPAFRSAWAEIAAKVPADFFEDLRTQVPPQRRDV